MGMMQEFKEFAMKGNVVDLAVGVIIGAAFGKIVESVVGDLIMPIVGAIVGKIDFSNLFVVMGSIPAGTAVTLDALKKAGVPVLAVDSLLTVAEEARHTALATRSAGVVTALLDARMDEMYCATYAFVGNQWTELRGSALVQPEKLLRLPTDPAAPSTPWLLAGNVFAVYGERVAADDPNAPAAQRITALPTASAMLRLAPALLAAGQAVPAEQALPSYIRDKVAKTTAERMAEKAVAALANAAVTVNVIGP